MTGPGGCGRLIAADERWTRNTGGKSAVVDGSGGGAKQVDSSQEKADLVPTRES